MLVSAAPVRFSHLAYTNHHLLNRGRIPQVAERGPSIDLVSRYVGAIVVFSFSSFHTAESWRLCRWFGRLEASNRQ